MRSPKLRLKDGVGQYLIAHRAFSSSLPSLVLFVLRVGDLRIESRVLLPCSFIICTTLAIFCSFSVYAIFVLRIFPGIRKTKWLRELARRRCPQVCWLALRLRSDGRISSVGCSLETRWSTEGSDPCFCGRGDHGEREILMASRLSD